MAGATAPGVRFGLFLIGEKDLVDLRIAINLMNTYDLMAISFRRRREKTIVVEGKHYFPLESVKKKYLEPSKTTSRCPWKGLANYYSIIVDRKIKEDAAWYYAKPSDPASSHQRLHRILERRACQVIA
jgi:hypothetical protein